MARIGLLVCDHVSPEFDHISGDYPDMFQNLVGSAPDVELVPYDLAAGEFPASPDECDGWLTTGSRHSVYDPVRWIERLADLTRDIVASGRPFVGVCFGHQMIAHALGGRVERAARGWGVGVKEVRVAEPPEWLGLDDYRVLNSHADQVTELPEGAVVLGGNDHCPVSLMALGDNVVGIQGHPEFVPAYVEALVRARRGTVIPDDVCEAALASLAREPDTRPIGEAIVGFLIRRIGDVAVS